MNAGSIRILVYLVGCLIAGSATLRGQVEPSISGARVGIATRTSRAPQLDGTLSDPIWSTASVISDFRQKEPLQTMPGTEKTEVRILYDSRHIYFGINCHTSNPKQIVASELRRDLSQDLDDNFAIVIDPTLSHRSGYVFQINPLGTERDGEVIEEQSPPATDSIATSPSTWRIDPRLLRAFSLSAPI